MCEGGQVEANSSHVIKALLQHQLQQEEIAHPWLTIWGICYKTKSPQMKGELWQHVFIIIYLASILFWQGLRATSQDIPRTNQRAVACQLEEPCYRSEDLWSRGAILNSVNGQSRQTCECSLCEEQYFPSGKKGSILRKLYYSIIRHLLDFLHSSFSFISLVTLGILSVLLL